MAIEGGQKVSFGPLRIRMAFGSGLLGIVVALGAIREFREHEHFLVGVLLVAAVECGLLTYSVLRRYIEFCEGGYLAHGFRGGLVPRNTFRAFKEI
jgi:hypothetical protein